ncbi:uncharacterized protein Z519_08043 [Cladophialophora bantiana CBS 173.52]|uniref:Zn(2)-C6 fungal-type domain-containing protein n=1 Tax=Cladophialophora bantiana (strain ATCC 10958 / CBS 173.52 / CDC B-1940 / NIH 8579) TaxID=1442370 RepID=A0A0D2HCY2_CLAB1|nr:uncharacterized protein Z519_08043 [Cladophialophora bantiana CBS 173.52]KIW91148.1 hypothetical protein Z519_08043 [Cladophialophora bantiana CBS 173.52]
MVQVLDLPTHETKIGPPRRRGKACITCKIRRVKCDYGQPSCNRCLNTGRKCDGYPTRHEKGQDQAPVAVLVVMNSPVPSQCDPEASMAIRFFIQVCAPAMLNYGSYHFWNELVLQACHVDESIKHLTIAASRIGSHRLLQPCKPPSNKDTVFLAHYGRALKLLSRSKSPDPGFLLIACLLLVLCDEFQDNSFAAIQHLIAGRKILTAYRPTAPSPQRNATIAELDQIFSALELHTSELYHITRPQSMSWWSPSSRAEAVRANFQGHPHLDPRRIWPRIEEEARALQDIAFECTALQLEGAPPQTRFQIVPGLTAKLNAWLGQLTTFESSMYAHLTSAMLTDLHLLRTYHLCLHTLSRCDPFRQEVAFDTYAGNLEHIVVSCGLLIRRRKIRLVPVLFFVATRYRNASFRRRAIDLLRQCGLDGQILAKIALRVVRIEERGLSAPIVSSDVPEDNRVRLVDVVFDGTDTRKYLLRFTRHPYSRAGDGDRVPLEETVLSSQACSWAVQPQTPSHAVGQAFL